MRCNRGVCRAIGLVLALVLGVVQAAVAEDAENELLEELQEPAFELPAVWQGDLDGIAERRLLRVLTTFSKTGYFLDGLTQRGATYELLQAFEKFLNEELKTKKALPVRILMVPVDRDTLLPALAAGYDVFLARWQPRSTSPTPSSPARARWWSADRRQESFRASTISPAPPSICAPRAATGRAWRS